MKAGKPVSQRHWARGSLVIGLLLAVMSTGVGSIAAARAAGGNPDGAAIEPGGRPLSTRQATVTLTVRTIPALAGVRISVDGAVAMTNSAGELQISRPHDQGSHLLEIVDASIRHGGQQLSFVRWAGQKTEAQAFSSSLTDLPLRADYTLTAAFTAKQAVTPRFIDENGRVIDPSLVTVATARSDAGVVVNLRPGSPTWLDETRVNFSNNVLTVEPVSYSWQSVVIAGSNVIDAGRQSFVPGRDTTATVVGKFHDLTIQPYDALTGSPAGRTVAVTFPDGSVRTVEMDASRIATLKGLPRGTYLINVKAGRAIVAGRVIRLSRDSVVEVPVISLLDLSLFTSVITLLIIAVLLVGRASMRQRLLRPIRRLGRARMQKFVPAHDPARLGAR